MNRINMLKECEIKVIVIFDGANLPLKDEENEERYRKEFHKIFNFNCIIIESDK